MKKSKDHKPMSKLKIPGLVPVDSSLVFDLIRLLISCNPRSPEGSLCLFASGMFSKITDSDMEMHKLYKLAKDEHFMMPKRNFSLRTM